MSEINQVVISGRLVRDPELRHLPSGDPVFENAVASERYKKDAENHVSFVDFKVYGKYAELLAQKTKKGDNVAVAGRLEQRSWENAEGEKRSKIEIIAYDVYGEFQYRPAGDSKAPSTPPATDDGIPF